MRGKFASAASTGCTKLRPTLQSIQFSISFSWRKIESLVCVISAILILFFNFAFPMHINSFYVFNHQKSGGTQIEWCSKKFLLSFSGKKRDIRRMIFLIYDTKTILFLILISSKIFLNQWVKLNFQVDKTIGFFLPLIDAMLF